jgi:sugar lactone lactonase YvrE
MNLRRIRHFFSFKKHRFLFLLVFPFCVQPVFGITPMEYYNSLVAGRDDAGFRDGAFSRALFYNPCGLAIDNSGNRLFVADRDNHRIRVVYLNEDNRVATIAGSNTPGKTDGSLSEASFNQPTVLAYLPGDRLAVGDFGNRLLRIINLRKKTVATLAGNSADTILGGIWGLAYFQKDNSLYFTEPGEKRFRKWNLKTQKLETVLLNDTQVPNPRALCVSEDKIYLADWNLPEVYQVNPQENAATAKTVLKKVGSFKNIITLASSNDMLYAAQSDTNALVRILPDNQTLGLATAWGFLAENNDPGVDPLLYFRQEGLPSGLVVSPKETRKLFVTSPDLNHAIISVKDYEFGKWMDCNTGGKDFDYPDKKPAGTFRILIIGDSRVGSAMLPTPKDELKGKSFDIRKWDSESTKRTNLFAKQLEFLLNAQAALNGARHHFEVLTICEAGTATGSIIMGPTLDLVKKKNVDLILAMASISTYNYYFGMPLTGEGLPGTFDAEYMLKPLSERVAPGVTRHFYELCKKKKLFRVEAGKFIWSIDFSKWDSLDAEIREDLIELTARPYLAFQKRLQYMKTPEGHSRKLLILYVPWGNWQNISYEHFWKDICSKTGLNLLNLSEPFYALKTSFYPTYQKSFTRHYLSYGNFLIAYLLSHYLPQQKWIPFETYSTQKPSSE